jgi:hypothetical protein
MPGLSGLSNQSFERNSRFFPLAALLPVPLPVVDFAAPLFFEAAISFSPSIMKGPFPFLGGPALISFLASP